MTADNHWPPGGTWLRLAGEFAGFVALFAAYDLAVLHKQIAAPLGVSLVDYIVRDGRTDESTMYMPTVRELADGEYRSTDPYLKERRTLPSIRPRLPSWTGYLCYLAGRTPNGAVVLLHAVPAALSAVLLLRMNCHVVGRPWGRLPTLLAIGGAAFQGNYYVELLRIAELAGPPHYNPELALLGPYSFHLEFSRYFSPSITFGMFMAGLAPAAFDPDLARRRTSLFLGAGIGLQMEAYPHGALILGVLAAALLAIGWRRAAAAGESWPLRCATLLRRTALMGLAAAIVSAPWVWRWSEFRKLPQARDIVERVGFSDERVDTDRTPILVWLGIAVLLRRGANRVAGRPAGELSATPADRFWTALLVASVITTWLPGIPGHYGLFPDPFLIPLRYTSYLAPLLVGYPVALWIRSAGPAWAVGRSGRRWATAATAAYTALLLYGEIAAGRNNAHLYVVTPEMARFRDAVLRDTQQQSIVMTDDLRLTSFLVCETDRYSYVGYGSSSNASTDELVERLMIPSIVAGLAFDEFYLEHYMRGFGLPNGPSGAHWALHHGGDTAPRTEADLRSMYDRLAALPPAKLLARHDFDYAYLTASPPVAPYLDFFDETPTDDLYARKERPPR